MPTVSRTFTVTPAPAVVLDYLKDFAHAEQWDPGTTTCTRSSSGPVAVGAQWHNTSKIMGLTTELTYTLEQLTADSIVLVGRNKTATSTDTITVRPVPGGSEVTYRAELTMHGAAKLGAPLMRLVFEKLAGDTEQQLTGVLNGLTG